MKSEKISQEIAALERKVSEAKNKVLKDAFEKKIAELRKELKKEEDGLAKLSSAKKKVRAMDKKEFNSYIKELSKKDGFSFLKEMTKEEIRRDIQRTAKPVGWRFRGDNTKKPTRKDIKGGNNVYWEGRRNRSDVSRSVKLETGGGVSDIKKGQLYDWFEKGIENTIAVTDVSNGEVSYTLNGRSNVKSISDFEKMISDKGLKAGYKMETGGGLQEITKEGTLNDGDHIQYEFDVHSIKPTFNHKLYGTIEKDGDEYYATYMNQMYDEHLYEKTFKTFEDAEKWVLSKMNKDKNDYIKNFGGKYAEGGGVKNDWFNKGVGTNGLNKIKEHSKQNPKVLFLVTDDNYSNIGNYYLLNGKFAKRTVSNASYDFQNNKATLKAKSDVIYKMKELGDPKKYYEYGGTAESSETGEFIGGENASSMYKDGGKVEEFKNLNLKPNEIVVLNAVYLSRIDGLKGQIDYFKSGNTRYFDEQIRGDKNSEIRNLEEKIEEQKDNLKFLREQGYPYDLTNKYDDEKFIKDLNDVVRTKQGRFLFGKDQPNADEYYNSYEKLFFKLEQIVEEKYGEIMYKDGGNIDYDYQIYNPEAIKLIIKHSGITKKDYDSLSTETKKTLFKNAISYLENEIISEKAKRNAILKADGLPNKITKKSDLKIKNLSSELKKYEKGGSLADMPESFPNNDTMSYATGGGVEKENNNYKEINGNNYFTYDFENKGNKWGVMIAWGKYNHVNVTKKTNNPFGYGIGKEFNTIGEAVDNYKDVNIKSNILFAANMAKEYGYEPKYENGGGVDLNELDIPVIRTQFEEEEFEYENGGAIFSRTKTTQDGKIVGKVQYNDFWKTYQVIIDGVVYEEFKTKEEAIDNLKRAGFDKMAQGGGIPNNYFGKSAEDVWNEWTETQRLHFLLDHRLTEINPRKVMVSFDELPESIKSAIKNHRAEGQYAEGGNIESENAEMVKSYNKQIAHHTKEMTEAMNNNGEVPAWVVAKMTRSASDLSDATHYMEGKGEEYAKGGGVRAKKQYNKEVDAYKFFVVDLENKKAVSGWEFKEDAKDALSDYDGDKNFKVVAESTLKAMGIENPKEQWKMENGGGVGSNKWQIKNSDGKYFSRNLKSGKPAWNDSPDMAYIFSQSEAEQEKQSLSKELGLNDLEVVEYNPNWWMMENGGGVLNYDFLIGKWVAMYIMGVKEPQYYTIKSVKATPEKYTNRDLIISFDLMTEERIPLTKVDSFLNGEQVELRDSSGEYYVLQLQKEYAKGGGVGFIPMDLETDLANVAKFGGTNIKGVIGILNAMIDSGLTDSDLKTAPTKTSAQYAKAKEKKTEEIWKKIKSNYKGDFEGNMYYSTIYRLVEIANDGDEILKKFKPFRKNQEFAKGGATPAQKRKVGKVMHEFKEGTLHSGKSDKVVKNPKQAVAIALSEAGLSKKESGGAMGWKSRMKNWKKK